MKKLLFISLFLMAAAPTMAQNPSDNAIEDKFVPPMIPHPVANFLPITPTKNACLMCHQPAKPGVEAKKGQPTPLSASHVTGDKVNPNRYECMLCHAEVLPAKK